MSTYTILAERCQSAWLHCEALLGEVKASPQGFSNRTRAVLDECAGICLGTLEALRGGATNLVPLALLCVGICAECAEVCARYGGSGFLFCAEACSACAGAMLEIADVC